MTITPGRMCLFNYCTHCETYYLFIIKSHQKVFRLTVKQPGYLIFIPGTIKICHFLRSKNFFSQMKYGCKIINGSSSYFETVLLTHISSTNLMLNNII